MSRRSLAALGLLLLLAAPAAGQTVKHRFTNPLADDPAFTGTKPSHWNDSHILAGGTQGQCLQRDTGAADGWSWGACVADNAVTLAKLADIATASFLGRTTALTGDPEVLTGTQATALLDVFTSALKGLAPASGGGTTAFLRADGTWAVPPVGTPGGLDTQVQFNDGGVFGGDAGLTYDKLTDILTVGGGVTVTAGQVQLPVGTVAAPALRLGSSGQDGLYLPSAGNLAVALQGQPHFNFNRANARFEITAGNLNAAFAWLSAVGGTVQLALHQDGVNNILAQRNGTAAQEARWYDTFVTSTDHRRVALRFSGGDAFLLHESAGASAGTMGNLLIGTAGAKSLRFRTGNVDRWQIDSGGHLTAQSLDTADVRQVRRLHWGETLTDPVVGDLAANAALAAYKKNNKLVFAYNNAGTITYLSIPLDGSTVLWTHSTVAP